MSVELESAARLAALKSGIEAKTGETYADLTGGVNALIAGYGTGGDDITQYITFFNGAVLRQAVYPDNYHAIFRFYGNTSGVSLEFAMSYSNMVKATIKVYNPPSTGFNATNGMFVGCTNLTEVNLENVPFVTKNANSMFNDCIALETINGILDVSGSANLVNMFGRAYSLKDVRFASESIADSINFNDSRHLTDESVQSIVDGLADLTGGTAQTITFYVDVKAKLTEDQISTITGKNWTLA